MDSSSAILNVNSETTVDFDIDSARDQTIIFESDDMLFAIFRFDRVGVCNLIDWLIIDLITKISPKVTPQ